MRGAILMLFVAAIVFGCKKDPEPTFTSAEGDWTYTTPDGKIGVDFSITAADAFTNQIIRVDGQAGKAEIQATGVDLPAVSSIRINANDSKLTYAYAIEFTNLTISSDFKQINVASASYTWPHDKTNSLTNIAITRK